MSNQSYQNVLCPFGAWSAEVQYIPQTVYGGVANSPLYLCCPTVTSSSHIYYANGFTSNGDALLPTLGLAPASDPAWQELDSSSSDSFVTLAVTSNTNPLVLGTTNTVTFTLTAQTAPHTFTLPNANSTAVVPNTSPVAGTFVSSINNSGVQLTQKLFNQTSGAPGVGNDNTQGYGAGSQWFNTATSFLYICISAGTGAAVWTQVLTS